MIALNYNRPLVAAPVPQMVPFAPFSGRLSGNAPSTRLENRTSGILQSQLGQQDVGGGPIPIEEVTDIDRVISVPEFLNASYDEKSALTIYNMVNLWISIRDKVVFSAKFYTDIAQTPSGLAAIRINEEDNVKVDILSRLAEKLFLPNIRRSVDNLAMALETQILPKKFGIALRGTRPVLKVPGEFAETKWDIYPQKIDMTLGFPNLRVVDFGDTFSTTIPSDDIALMRIYRELPTSVFPSQLGQWVQIASFVLALFKTQAFAILLRGLTYLGIATTLKDFFKGPPDPSKDSPWWNSLTPEEQLEYKKNKMKSDSAWDKAIQFAQWVVGGIVLIIGGMIAYQLLED